MRILGVCGDDCTECPRRLATLSGDRSRLAALAALWVKAGIREVLPAPEELECWGCTPANPCAYADQRRCALQRAFATCGECPEYPCDVAARGLERSDAFAARCRAACSPEEWEPFRKAFFCKRENLRPGGR